MKTFTITETARAAGVSIQILRYWIKQSWISKPAVEKPNALKKRYAQNDVEAIVEFANRRKSK